MRLYTSFGSRVLFPLHERLKGHDTVAIARALERSQWLPRADLLALQHARLRALLATVSSHVPFYRQHFAANGVDAGQIDTLAALPIIDKACIRRHLAEWQAEGAHALSRHSTSGSSGEPLIFLLGKHRISFDIAAKWRATRWWDVDIGDREMVLWGSPLETAAQDRVRRLRDRLLRSRLVPARELDAPRLDAILAEMRAFRPRMLFGYPSALARIARHARERGLAMDDLGIRVAFCTSEVLQPEWRTLIAATFGCGVANEYGARDAGFIARECSLGGLHITAEELIVEVVDEAGEPVADGVEGDILVTNLAGPEFPFIRYRTGDRGVLAGHDCPCGRSLPLLAAISGRANDGLIDQQGRWIHGSAINHVVRELDGLLAYRVVQESRDAVDIALVLERPLAADSAHRLERHVRRLLGAEVRVCIAQVDAIPAEANGKFRHVVCRVAQPGMPAASMEAAR